MERCTSASEALAASPLTSILQQERLIYSFLVGCLLPLLLLCTALALASAAFCNIQNIIICQMQLDIHITSRGVMQQRLAIPQEAKKSP